jgi:murein endopeptidase
VGGVVGGLWWAWYSDHQGPLKPKGQPTPAKGSAREVNVQLPPGDGYRIARPHKAYGQGWVVERLLAGLGRYHELCGGAPDLTVGNLSRLGGGPLPPHKSHQWGTDVDVFLPNGKDRRWCLVRAFLEDADVEFIFLDQSLINMHRESAPEPFAAELGKPGRVRHWPGHKDHIHVRWRDDA